MPQLSPTLTFIDLFAGIGGMRLAFESIPGLDAECLFSSEWDKFAQDTYEANFGEKPFGDITEIPSAEIPVHDVLLAGFPCQPFSLAGVSKKNSLGRPHGFDDPTQGTLFFEIKRILEKRTAQAFLLENVKNLRSHDGGQTFSVIEKTLRALHFHIDSRVIDAAGWVPQHRERIFIVGFRDPAALEAFEWPTSPNSLCALGEILQKENVDPKYTLSDNLWDYLQAYAIKHREKGNGFGFGLADLSGPSRTLSARYHKDGSEILIPQTDRNPRRLTPQECAELQGFTQFRSDFKIPVSDTQAYRQFGNAVAVPVVQALGANLVDALRKVDKTDVKATA